MASEQFSLCWDNFHKNMSSGMQSLLESEDLVDVTLAVEGRYLKAHKMVLSVCSPYFRELFQANPCKHPIVFMKDVSYIALSDLLQFMYQGEVQVAQENLSVFIKTAEALQIKGLTGDNGSQAESEVGETLEIEKPIAETMKRTHEVTEAKTTPISRVKRPAGPASKRPRYILPAAQSTPAVAPVASTSPSVTNKAEVSSASSGPTTEEMIQFKMEPNETGEQSQVEGIDDSQVDDIQDDTEDYTLLETGDDEPKAGTSADGMGDSQDVKFSIKIEKKRKKRVNTRMRFVVDGFVYHNNLISGTPPLRYLGCAEHKRAGCRGRATLPLDGTLDQLKITQPHNHPPDITAEEKHAFVVELKNAVRSMENSTLKNVYETVAEIYPQGASQISFRSISSSLHRWRHNPNM